MFRSPALPAAPLVLMLHGFCVSRHFWHNQIPALAEAGYLAVAPNQRGYSVDSRPDPSDFDSYRVDRLIGDALDIVAATGHGERRFHLVGHDWGGSLLADRYPERIASLAMLSRPHPASFARALKMRDGEQAHWSQYHQEFLDPTAGPRLLADNAAWVRTRFAGNGVPKAAIAAHLSVIVRIPAKVIGNAGDGGGVRRHRARSQRQPIGPTRCRHCSSG
jgi:pimeloyl-ACP methyl ester carboxylesterase